MVHGKEIPWYWCFIVMMVVENTFFYCRVYSIVSAKNYTKVIKDTIKHQHTIIHTYEVLYNRMNLHRSTGNTYFYIEIT